MPFPTRSDRIILSLLSLALATLLLALLITTNGTLHSIRYIIASPDTNEMTQPIGRMLFTFATLLCLGLVEWILTLPVTLLPHPTEPLRRRIRALIAVAIGPIAMTIAAFSVHSVTNPLADYSKLSVILAATCISAVTTYIYVFLVRRQQRAETKTT